jgi:patatin-like phospholipase/acyl hydrolase
MPGDTFNILSIDGGGIRGIFPAKFLQEMEDRLHEKGYEYTKIHEHFDLICGTSTGGIIAIALALGIPASEIQNLYFYNASQIFRRRDFFGLVNSKYDSRNLEQIVKSTYQKYFDGQDPRLNDCKTNICVPIYDLFEGKTSVLKTPHHGKFNRDYHILAYQAALATSAAPTYFTPYSSFYYKIGSNSNENFSNKVDGGIFANNPTMIGLIEAQKAFGKELNEIKVLSLGTGNTKNIDVKNRKRWGLFYWMNPWQKSLIDLFMQSQSQNVNNLIQLLQKGIGSSEKENFVYDRIDFDLKEGPNIDMDDKKEYKLSNLSEKAKGKFQEYGSNIIMAYCNWDSNTNRV